MTDEDGKGVIGIVGDGIAPGWSVGDGMGVEVVVAGSGLGLEVEAGCTISGVEVFGTADSAEGVMTVQEAINRAESKGISFGYFGMVILHPPLGTILWQSTCLGFGYFSSALCLGLKHYTLGRFAVQF